MKRIILILILILAGAMTAFGDRFGTGVSSGSISNALSNGSVIYIKPNGVNDNVQIQAANDALTSGGLIQCAPGDYVFLSNVELSDDVWLWFQPGNAITIGATHTLEDDTITAGTATVTYLIANENVESGSNENIRVIGANFDFEAGPDTTKFDEDKSYFGIFFNNCTRSYIMDCVGNNVVYGLYDSGATYRGIAFILANCTNSHIVRCYAEYCGYEGMSIRGASRNCTITDSEAAADADDFNIYGMKLVYRVGLQATQ